MNWEDWDRYNRTLQYWTGHQKLRKLSIIQLVLGIRNNPDLVRFKRYNNL